MKKPKPDGSMEGANGSKAFAKKLVSQYATGTNLTRFSVVSFASEGEAKTRVTWSFDDNVINKGIDEMSAENQPAGTSISGGFETVKEQLYLDSEVREGATKVLLLLSNGKQSDKFAKDGKSPMQTVVDEVTGLKEDGVKVFAWGFGDMTNFDDLEFIASDPSKAIHVKTLSELNGYLDQLLATVCTVCPTTNAKNGP